MSSKKEFLIVLAVSILFSTLLIAGNTNAAARALNLPSTPVVLEAFDSTQAYFNTTLSSVPSGYDVSNSTYLGWCIDKSAQMDRSPNQHHVNLYSSLAPSGVFVGQAWDMVNYVLNHKQGTPADIQDAIWHFISFTTDIYNTTRPLAQAMINDAVANGTGFVPSESQKVAVICNPSTLFPGEGPVQISIIELAVPSAAQPTPTPTSTSPTPTPTPTSSTPTPTPSSTVTPTPSPTSGTPTPTPKPTGTSGGISPAILYAAAIVGVAAIVAVVALLLRRRKK
jgi:hypothetical protein